MSGSARGAVWGLGVGPGDPELITLKALRYLTAADAIAYPAPEHGESLARSIVAPHLRGERPEIAIRMPLSGEPFPAAAVYESAAREIGGYVTRGQNVAVLCEGDPFFYGSFMYLFARLAEKHAVEVVPGVSSLTAAAARLAAPLAAKTDVLTVLPAPLGDAALRAGIEGADAVAIIKLGRHFARIRDLIVSLGLADNARYIERATMANERHLPLAAVDPASVPYFSLILVHKRHDAWR